VFAFLGDGINPILAAWGRADDRPEFIQSRHEEMSAFEAVGYAKFADRLGVCMATSGPGAVHLLNGLYDASWTMFPSSRSSDRPTAARFAAPTRKRST
jgi:pyruvate dehydrogenase (quinone)